MVSDETALPDTFDPKESINVIWTARLGSMTYASPIVAGGKVYIGTCNPTPQDDRLPGDRGVLLCLKESDGKLLWRLVVPKLWAVKYGDWHNTGITSPPTVAGERAYLVTHLSEVLCLDANGLANGNDGPFKDEARHMAGRGEDPIELRKTDADIVWRYDMRKELGVNPHNATNCSILLRDGLLYVCTSNGVDWTHKVIPNPRAPSLIVLDAKTGRLIATENAGIGRHVFHGQWSSPSFGKVAQKPLVFFGGGDGVCYAFEPAAAGAKPTKTPATLKTAWRYQGDTVGRWIPGAAATRPPNPDGPSVIIGMPVFHDNRVYVAVGGDPWHGKRTGALHCIDATKTGDITRSGRIWSYERLGRSIATPAIKDGLVYIAGHGGRVHCLDAETGKPYWVHDAGGEICGSTLLADGKIHVGTTRRSLWVLAVGKTKKVIGRIRLRAAIHSTPTAANGRLYVAAGKTLYAVGTK